MKEGDKKGGFIKRKQYKNTNEYKIFESIKKSKKNGGKSLDLIGIKDIKKDSLLSTALQIAKIELPNLEKLTINDCDLEDISIDLNDYFKKLKILDVSHNQISNIPSKISEIVGLEKLVAIDNKITEIPYEINFFSNLKELNLMGNMVKEVILNLAVAPKLEVINLQRNPLLESSVEFLKKGMPKSVKIMCVDIADLEHENKPKQGKEGEHIDNKSGVIDSSGIPLKTFASPLNNVSKSDQRKRSKKAEQTLVSKKK